ncbi:glycerophosphodiester phosphodiesterase family protein [Oceanicoccus sagamiensis]|uniref:GP-PDE domain-containing protein n=1 Tax=Oceanicoccus sagamiensis TaxID=716816 RepID=A0A1X9N9H7_9GAMM|nr:glycerophosphodiester phosphodiesterase family protein [Oceanicoccus sagamiensis]ARN73734.1 hypothetical protein BST96_06165 [Oceanicoccus sagamiensis]
MHDLLIAHRGWQRRYPENTLLGIEQALLLGARHIEIDIQLTADAVPVLCHDQTLERLSASPLNINHCLYTDLAEHSAYEPQRLGDQFLGTPLSTLAECLTLLADYPETTLYIELKVESAKTFGADCIFEAIHPLIQHCANPYAVISFSLELLQLFQQRGGHRVVPVLSSWQQAFSEEVQILNPPLIFCDIHLIPEDSTPADLPYPSAFYEVDRPELAQQLLSEGAALIETFAIGEMLNAESTANT